VSDLKDVCQRFYKEVFDNRNLNAIDDFLTEDAVEHEAPPPGVDMPPGREGVKQLIGVYLAAFKPITVEVHEQYRDGATVINRVTMHAAHTGEFMGIPATGNKLAIEGIDIVRFAGDRMAEHWGHFDSAGLFAQLGVLPRMG
jgi:hypothetical protein